MKLTKLNLFVGTAGRDGSHQMFDKVCWQIQAVLVEHE